MKKPKSRTKRVAEGKRGKKRSDRFKASREKVARVREAVAAKNAAEKKKYEEFMAKMLDARLKGGF
jgi:predicted transcriptional regulator